MLRFAKILNMMGSCVGVLAVTACGTSATTNPFLSANPTRVPTIRLENPSSPGEAVDDSYTFNVAFGSVILGDSWTLFYMSESSVTKGGAIVQDMAVSNHTIRWTTTDLPSGSYYFYGELMSNGGVITTTAPGSIVIDHPVAAGNHSPTVSLANPSGGSVDAGSTEKITWTSQDADGDVVTYKVELSADAGNTWTQLASGVTDETYDWTVTQAAGLSYKVRVTATDSKGAASSDQSHNVFSIQ